MEVLVVCAVVIYVVIGAVATAVGGAGMLAAGSLKGFSHLGGGSSAPGQVHEATTSGHDHGVRTSSRPARSGREPER